MPFKAPHPLYSTWQRMRGRCLNPNDDSFKNYGGRGIKICQEWNSFAKFAADMGDRPPGKTLDRIDNDGDYTPENCRWATKKEQQRNRRDAVFVVVDGVTHRAVELAEMAGVKTDTILKRAKRGLAIDQVASARRQVGAPTWKTAVKARVAAQLSATHCRNGHEWTPENTRITKEGWRNCRACHREKMRKRKAARAREQVTDT